MSQENFFVNVERIADSLEILVALAESGQLNLSPSQLAQGIGNAFTGVASPAATVVPAATNTNEAAAPAATGEKAPRTRRTKAQIAADKAAAEAAATGAAAAPAGIPMPTGMPPIPGVDPTAQANTFGAQAMPPIPGVGAQVQQQPVSQPNVGMPPEFLALAGAFAGKDPQGQWSDVLSLFSAYSNNQGMRDTLLQAAQSVGQALPLSNSENPALPGERWYAAGPDGRTTIFYALAQKAAQIKAGQAGGL